MKLPSSLILFAFAISAAGTTQAQQSRSTKSETRPRLVAATRVQTSKYQEPANVPNRSAQDEDRRAESPRHLSPNRLRLRINEAERLMKARPVLTAMTPSIEYVTLAALLPETSKIHLIRVDKHTFLTKGSVVSATSSLGLPVQVRIVRANGVNTAVNIFDNQNRSLLPLV